MYTLRYPTEQRYRGRKLRTSPLHTRLEVQGACFGETNAYERPMWFTNSHGMQLSDFWRSVIKIINFYKGILYSLNHVQLQICQNGCAWIFVYFIYKWCIYIHCTYWHAGVCANICNWDTLVMITNISSLEKSWITVHSFTWLLVLKIGTNLWLKEFKKDWK